MVTNIHSVGNALEACLWLAMAAVLGILAARRSLASHFQWAAAAVLVLFGLSDVVEIQTGAWWRPWWLLAWKLACVTILLLLRWRWVSRHAGEGTTNGASSVVTEDQRP